jgi:DNA-binding NarL/FixJ family response regulator
MKRLRVLIADDHPLFAESLTSILSADDRFEVVGCASNGEEAVEMAASLAPDVVLMDLEMPVMDGLEATRRINERAGARVLLLTGSDSSAVVAHARTAGASDYLRKDMDSSDLLARVLAAGLQI